MADIIGKEYRYLDSFNASGESRSQASVGGTKHLAHILEPIEFSKLLKPDGTNPYAAAIVYLGGKTFNANNRNYLPVYFSRE